MQQNFKNDINWNIDLMLKLTSVFYIAKSFHIFFSLR